MTITITAGQTAQLSVQSSDYSGGPPTNPDDLEITITRLSDLVVVVGPTSAGIATWGVGAATYSWTTTEDTEPTTYGYQFSALNNVGDPIYSTPENIVVLPAATTSTAYAIGATSLPQPVPYLSLGIVKSWKRLGIDVKRLVPQGTSADNDAALMQYIRDSTDWVNGICLQTLNATVDTVMEKVWINRRGYAEISPRYRPVLALTAASFGSSPSTLSALSSLSGAGVEPGAISIPVGPVVPVNSSQGPIQLGAVAAPMDNAWCQYSYVNGHPVTYLTDSLAAGSVTIPVQDTTGIIAGRTWMTLYAGKNQARVLITSVSNAVNGLGFGPGELGCSPLPFAVPNDDLYPTLISALPGDAMRACLYALRSDIKSTGTGSVSGQTSGKQQAKDPLGAGDDLAQAEEMLRKGGYVVAEV